jgi:hypothetical protein
MKSITRGRVLFIVAILLLVSSQTVMAADGPGLQLSANPASVMTGQQVSVDALIKNAPLIYGADVRLIFDPNRLEVVDADPQQAGVQITPGDFLDPAHSFYLAYQVDNATGNIAYALTLLGVPAVQGDGLLARITFIAKTPGQTTVSIVYGMFGTTTGDTIMPDLGSVDILIDGGTLTRTPTSTPTQYPTGTMAATKTLTPTATATFTPTTTGTGTPTLTSTHTPYPTGTMTVTKTFTPTVTITPTLTATRTATSTLTRTRTATSTPTPVVQTFTSVAAQDGWVLESAENSNVGGTMNSAATTFNLGDNAAKKQYRGILSFSTGGLPDNAIITGVTLKVKKQAIVGGGNPVAIFKGFMFDIKNGFFGTVPTLQTGDFQATASASYGPFNTALSGGWYSINLTGAGAFVNKLAAGSGLTQIRLRFGLDDNNNALANYLSLYSGNAPAASRPQLVITYIVP